MGSFGEHDVPKSTDRVSLDRFLKEAQTGDIVLFSGKGFDSDIIRFVSHDRYLSHVGVVIRDRKKDKLYILESNRGLEPFDLYTQSYKDGVRLSDARSKVGEYVGYFVAWRRLIMPDEERFNEKWEECVMGVVEEVHKEVYTKDAIELYRSTIGTNTTESKGYFCTKLVAHFYIMVGLIDESIKDNNYALWQFTSGFKLPFASKNYKLRSERIIVHEKDNKKKKKKKKRATV